MINETVVTLLEFNKPDKNGFTVQLNEVTEKMVRDVFRREQLYCEWGVPKINLPITPEIIDRVQTIKFDNVCGVLTHLQWNNDQDAICARFKSFGAMGEHIPALSKGHFAMRGLTKDGVLTEIITWDWVLN